MISKARFRIERTQFRAFKKRSRIRRESLRKPGKL
jgi:hypothetical protein